MRSAEQARILPESGRAAAREALGERYTNRHHGPRNTLCPHAGLSPELSVTDPQSGRCTQAPAPVRAQPLPGCSGARRHSVAPTSWGSARRGAHPAPSLVPYLARGSLASIPSCPQHCWAAFLGSETCFPRAQLLCCLVLPAHPAAPDKGPRSASLWPALQSESSPEPAGGWKKCELSAVRADKGPDECAAPPPEPGSLQRPRPPAPCSSLGPKQNLPLWRSPKQATFVSHSGHILFLFRVSEGQLAFGK